jgi:hypothetical protein
MCVPACPETQPTTDEYGEKDALLVVVAPNISHIVRVSAVRKWPAIPRQIFQDTNKM